MADMAKRFGSLFLAGIFLVTTLAFTAVIYWQYQQQQKDEDLQAQLSEALQEEGGDETNQENENMLKGTPLANFTPITQPATELQIIDLVEGTGDVVPEGATITAHYTGAYASTGEIFESSKDSGQPATFPLSNVIEGWQKGVPGMKEGGTRRLIIPGSQAYGEAPEGYVPGSSDRPLGTLVFDIELVSIQ